MVTLARNELTHAKMTFHIINDHIYQLGDQYTWLVDSFLMLWMIVNPSSNHPLKADILSASFSRANDTFRWRTLSFQSLFKENEIQINCNPVNTGRKLNVDKTFRRRPGRLLNLMYVQFMSCVFWVTRKKRWYHRNFLRVSTKSFLITQMDQLVQWTISSRTFSQRISTLRLSFVNRI